jgi:hypothetical protein
MTFFGSFVVPAQFDNNLMNSNLLEYDCKYHKRYDLEKPVNAMVYAAPDAVFDTATGEVNMELKAYVSRAFAHMTGYAVPVYIEGEMPQTDSFFMYMLKILFTGIPVYSIAFGELALITPAAKLTKGAAVALIASYLTKLQHTQAEARQQLAFESATTTNT